MRARAQRDFGHRFCCRAFLPTYRRRYIEQPTVLRRCIFTMKKILGITALLVVVCIIAALASDRFLSGGNLENLIRRTALFGIISIGVAFVIVTGGVDLSIGSVVCLIGCGLPWALRLRPARW